MTAETVPLPPEPDLPLGRAARLATEALAVILALSSMRPAGRGATAERLDEAIEALRGVVLELQHGAAEVDRVRAGPRAAADAGSTAVDEADDALAEAHGVLLRLWAEAVVTPGDEDPGGRITDASRLVRLARLTLTTTAVR